MKEEQNSEEGSQLVPTTHHAEVKPSLIQTHTQPPPTLSHPAVSTAAVSGPTSDQITQTVSFVLDDLSLLDVEVKLEEEEECITPQRVCLPDGWIHTLPEADQRWISNTLFRWTAQGHPELDFSKVDRLWWYPPNVPLQITNVPALEQYFGHPLMLWMPQKLWQVKLVCPNSFCENELLISAGLHQEIRQVVRAENMYFVASEYLVCQRCKRKVVSWSHAIISQLKTGHMVQFPCILTAKLACDFSVVSSMRQTGLACTSVHLQRNLQERHAEVWLQKALQYMTDFMRAMNMGLICSTSFQPPPAMLPVPKHLWLMQVYAQDVLQRLDDIKATITSQFGRILKMNSTKKVTRRLTGKSFSTSTWATNVCNEHGQVVMSVLTASEGFGLEPMIEGLIKRFKVAGVPSPEVLYVDRDCCGNSLLRKTLEQWEHVEIRLDIWHFMQRFSMGCTTVSHSLYSTFMSRLSKCIFTWAEEDLTALKEAKRADPEAKNKNSSDADVLRSITQSELTLYCKRVTRGTSETLTLIESLVQAFDGDKGRDTLGVPLINSTQMREILKSQQKHVACIQDPPDVQLYLQTGTAMKGGHRLPTYRCVRGSTSLESFHQHLNQFIPGTLANDVFFQACLLDGLSKWNEDQAAAATGSKEQPNVYSHPLSQAANTLAKKVLGERIFPCVMPSKNTGELIGVEYLYQQTGQVLQDFKRVIEESETTDVEVGDGFPEAEECLDMTVATIETEERAAAFQSTKETSAPAPPAASSTPTSSVAPPPRMTPPAVSSTPTSSVAPPPGMMPPAASSTPTPGITALVPPMTGRPKRPADLQKKQSLHLRNTTGKVKLKGERKLQAISQAPLLLPAAPGAAFVPYMVPSVQLLAVSSPSQVMATPGCSQVILSLPVSLATPLSAQTQSSTGKTSHTAQQYKRKQQEINCTGTVKRKYVKKTDVIICRKCKTDRKPPLHRQYFGNWYCEKSETQSYDEWRAVLEKRGYRKNKTKQKTSGNEDPPAS